ncbi:GGDEF domain-containing protein [Vibrio maerlii]|uniref:GGDEF domain-containing protein n=1 Tax=Vibrio maerlii TaxID=2231648 RepID=UPI000E3BCEFF|nr:GGDEF domain-containing protein [Vibrio maerlii]
MNKYPTLLSHFMKFFLFGAFLYMCLAFIIGYEREQRNIEEVHTELIEKLALTVSKSAAIALFVNSEEIANEVTSALLLHDEIAGVAIGHSKSIPFEKQTFHQGYTHEGVMTFSLNSPVDGIGIGYLTIYPDTQVLNERSRTSLQVQLKRQFIQFVIMLLLVLLGVRSLVIEPLRRFAAKVSLLKPGDGLFFETQSEATSREVAMVMDSFNRFSNSSVAMIERERGLRSKIERMESHYRNLALVDPLTQLASRYGSERFIEENLTPVNGFALFILDLDGFKSVNDCFGHQAGDKVLIQVADRLSKLTPKNGLAARLGGDELLVTIPCNEKPDDETLLALAQEFINAISQPVDLQSNQEVSVGCSIGISFDTSESFNLSKTMKQADEALYSIKNNGKNGARIHRD